ncbi:Iron-sulfur cluster carrier protein [Ureibacillus acetophenoni]
MRDQAEKLRMKMLENLGALGRSIAVVSGKGGVGKSNFTTNFAIMLARLGRKLSELLYGYWDGECQYLNR